MWQAWHFTCQKSFCVTFAILLNLHHFLKMTSIFRGARSTLDIHLNFAWRAQHFGRLALHIFANHFVRAASSGHNGQIAWQALHFVPCYEN